MDITSRNFSFKGSRVLSHILFWVLYIVFVLFQFTFFSKESDYLRTTYVLVLTSVVDIFAAYITVYYLLPKFLFKKKYFLFAITFLVFAAISILFQRAILYFAYPYFYPEYAAKMGTFWHINPFYSFMNIYTIVAFFAVVKLLKFWYKNQKYKLELENKNKTSELALLRTQLNPHFLFNTLNNIDSLIISNQEKASDAIIKLSEILRFMIYDTAVEKVSLEKEIGYLRSYISLQKLRLKDPNFVKFDIEGTCAGKYVAPLLFIPFIENAFKHGLKNIESPGIKIKLICSADSIYFEVRNQYNENIISEKDNTSGIGLANTQRRLELLYPDMFDFVIEKKNGVYSSFLTIKIDTNS